MDQVDFIRLQKNPKQNKKTLGCDGSNVELVNRHSSSRRPPVFHQHRKSKDLITMKEFCGLTY